MQTFKYSATLAVAILLLSANDSAVAKSKTDSKEKDAKVLICHVGNEVGPNGETYDPACVPSAANQFFCADAGKIDLISVSDKAARKHLESSSHSYDGISDYKPGDVGASGQNAEDDDDSDFIDEGCEIPRDDERLYPCADRKNYYDCRPYAYSPCVLGTGPCECNWDAVVLSPFSGEDLCPGINEAEPKNGDCLSTPFEDPEAVFCAPIACDERVTLQQCRPDNCAETGSCSCQWDAISIGFSGDECPGTNEDDPCHVQLPGDDPFCS